MEVKNRILQSSFLRRLELRGQSALVRLAREGFRVLSSSKAKTNPEKAENPNEDIASKVNVKHEGKVNVKHEGKANVKIEAEEVKNTPGKTETEEVQSTPGKEEAEEGEKRVGESQRAGGCDGSVVPKTGMDGGG